MFRQRIEGNSSRITPRTTMIATILFVAFEFLQGNVQAADSLITSGLLLLKDSVSIIQGAKRRRRPKTLTKMEKLQRTFDDGMDELEYLLPRLSAVTGFSAFCIPQHDPARELLPSILAPGARSDFPELGFTTFERATQMWSEFEPRGLMFVARHLSMTLRNIPFDMAQAQREQAEFIILLYQWRDLFEGYVRTFAEQSSAGLAGVGVDTLKQCIISGNEQMRELRMLQIHCLLQIIFMSCCLDHTGLAFDGFMAEYRELLDRCRSFLAEQPNNVGFTLDYGVIPTLAFIISTCRSHDLRMEAYALCQSVEWREGAWDAKVEAVGKMGQIALEESGMDASGFIPPDSRYHWTMGTWDMAQQKLVAEYTRFTPDEFGLPVQVKVALDVI
ncbi:putative c6 zinc finger domain-containing protein [Phaeoacremonium minimum UCRPA7]|uniref:Putative c6 zinc finger domain-containing protein n=1 Tax=Phaeoacremonium minimum (strain UCR-PA7) TaxID=1286976 RepID=R8BIC3_PHAM7|nr:putative c6 zinc finger domain-containing protein [Phaeoacremonium minimum UCRPA7]EON99061.1 putative c6 zinc finger domain-containing protein [Phaeoacremonium minimum UCRPA7]